MQYNKFASVSKYDQEIIKDALSQSKTFPDQSQVKDIEGAEYKLYSAEMKVKKWSICLKLFGVLCFFAGVIKIVSSVLEIVNNGETHSNHDNSNYIEVVLMGEQGLFVNIALDIVRGILNLSFGFYILKTLEDLTSKSLWKLFKFGVILTITHFVIIGIQFIIVLGTYKDNHEDEKQDQNSGENTAPTDESELNIAEEYSDSVFLFIITTFFITCCIMSCYSVCTLGLTYKLHDANKELDMIQTQQPSPVPNVSVSASQIQNDVRKNQIVSTHASTIE